MACIKEMSFVSAPEQYNNVSRSQVNTGFPDPFAVATIGGEQTRTTSVIKKTLNPYWNEVFDMCVAVLSDCAEQR